MELTFKVDYKTQRRRRRIRRLVEWTAINSAFVFVLWGMGAFKHPAAIILAFAVALITTSMRPPEY